MPRMATQQTADSVVAAYDSTMFIDHFDRVLGAGGVKTALLAEQWAKHQLVSLNQLNQ